MNTGGLLLRRRLRRATVGAMGLLVASGIGVGCTFSQPTPPLVSSSEGATNAAVATISQSATTPQRALPFKGKLIDGDPDELPPAVAAALSSDTPITFSYREQLTHDEYHIPLMISALDPVTLAGAPLGDYGVTAFASLTVREGDEVLGTYTAKAHVSKSYSLYKEPTHRELEQAARIAVRDKIDQRLDRDADHIAGLINHSDDHSAQSATDSGAR